MLNLLGVNWFINPLHFNISMQVPHTVLYTSPMMRKKGEFDL